jgi:hypothetical protein
VPRKTHASIHDEFGFPMAGHGRQRRQVGTVAIAAAAVGVAGLDVLWWMLGDFHDLGSQIPWIALAIVFGVVASCAPAFPSSRDGLGVASVSLAIVTTQFVIMCMAFNFNAWQPNPGVAPKMEARAPESNDTAIIDLLERTGLLSTKEAERIRENRGQSQAPIFGHPVNSAPKVKDVPVEQ